MFLVLSSGAAWGRTEDVFFVFREDCLDKGLFNVAGFFVFIFTANAVNNLSSIKLITGA